MYIYAGNDLIGQSIIIITAVSRKEDYYKILGVPRTASTEEIKKSYYEVTPIVGVAFYDDTPPFVN